MQVSWDNPALELAAGAFVEVFTPARLRGVQLSSHPFTSNGMRPTCLSVATPGGCMTARRGLRSAPPPPLPPVQSGHVSSTPPY